MQQRCNNDIDTIACIPNRDYLVYVKDICSGNMPWAKVDLTEDPYVPEIEKGQHPHERKHKISFFPFLLVVILFGLLAFCMYSVYQIS